jgi:hypothetical protein
MLRALIILQAVVAARAVLAALQTIFLYWLAFTFAAYAAYDLARLLQWPGRGQTLASGLFLLATRHRGLQTIILGAYRVPTTAQRDLLSPAIAAVPPNPNCVIEGNMGARDGCIYHMPGGRFYDQLKMEPSVARRWF